MKGFVISGSAQHGKDTTASFMKEELERAGYTVLITHYADLLKYICKQYFDWNGEKDEDGRTLLQYVGTDIIRRNDPDFWVNFIISMLKFFGDRWDYVLIPDTRFPNEIIGLRSAGFQVVHIQVVRSGFEDSLTDEQREHVSETALSNVKPTFCFYNDGGLSDLQLKIITWIKENITNGN